MGSGKEYRVNGWNSQHFLCRDSGDKLVYALHRIVRKGTQPLASPRPDDMTVLVGCAVCSDR